MWCERMGASSQARVPLVHHDSGDDQAWGYRGCSSERGAYAALPLWQAVNRSSTTWQLPRGGPFVCVDRS